MFCVRKIIFIITKCRCERNPSECWRRGWTININKKIKKCMSATVFGHMDTVQVFTARLERFMSIWSLDGH